MSLIKRTALSVGLLFIAQTVSAATVAGSTPGNFAVNENGAATYTIPIQVPPGINNIAPQLALTYNSQKGNGPVGMGWSLSGLSSISRCAANLALDGIRAGIDVAAERFCLDGARLINVGSGTDAAGAAYREYRTEIDNFSKIRAYGSTIAAPTHFKVWAKGGSTISEYGNTANSKQVLGSWTLTWALNKVTDQNTNYYTVTYETFGKTLYPKTIDYTGNTTTSLAANRQVSISYTTRTDIITQYLLGVAITIDRRLDKIVAKHGDSQVHSYQLSYGSESTGSNRIRLGSITECGTVGTACYTPTGFTYNSEGNLTFTQKTPATLTSGSEFGIANTLVDFNGDGLVDIVKTSGTSAIVLLAKTDGSYNSAVTTNNVITAPTITGNGIDQWNEIIDVNGDGVVDIFRISNTSTGAITVHYGTASGGFSGSYVPGTGYITLNSKGFRYANQLIDMNGDGLMDIVSVTGTIFYVKYGYRNSSGVYTLAACSTSDTTCAFNALAISNSTEHGFRQTNQFADMNGDGIIDVFQVKSGELGIDPTNANRGKVIFGQVVADATIPGGRLRYTLTGGDQPGVVTPILFEKGKYAGYFNYYNQLVDVNGDGVQDIVRVNEGTADISNGPTIISQSVNNVQQIVTTCNTSSFSPCNTYVVKTKNRKLEQYLRVRLGEGDGTFSEELEPPTDLGNSMYLVTGSIDNNLFFQDRVNGTANYICTVTGSTQTVRTVKNGPTTTTVTDRTFNYTCDAPNDAVNKGLTQLNQFTDIDSDGFVDIISASSSLSTNNVYVAYGNGDGTFDDRIQINNLTLSVATGFRAGNRLADMNGDGITDFFIASGTSGAAYVSNRVAPSRIEKVTNSYTLATNINYLPLTNPNIYTKTSAVAYPLRKVTIPMYVVDRHSVTDGTFNYNYSYQYKDAMIDVKRGWLGFNETSVVDKRSAQNLETRTRYRQDYPYIGRPDLAVTRFYASNDSMVTAIGSLGNLLSRTAVTWNFRANFTNVNYVYEQSRDERKYDPDNAFAQVISTVTAYQHVSGDTHPYDLWGNPEKVAITNTVDTHKIESTYTNTYASSDFPGQLGTQTVEVKHTTPAKGNSTRKTKQTFDAKARLQQQINQEGDALVLTTNYTYDNYGQIASQSSTGWDGTYDASGNRVGTTATTRSTSFAYTELATRNWKVTQTTTVGSINHIQETMFDAFWGVPKQVKDPNGIITWFDFDEFGRKKTDTLYYGTAQAVSTVTAYTSCTTDCKTGVKLVITVTPPGVKATSKQYDALEREIRTINRDINDTTNIYADTEYDIAGRVWKVSNPYFANSTTYWSESTYDNAGRPYRTISPNLMEVKTTYLGMKTTVSRITSDEGTQATAYTRDSQGNVTTVLDAAGSATTYKYSPFNLLADITDAANNLYSFGYDVLGNKTSQVDPDMGTWAYRPNAFGETKWQKDAKAQITGFTYDVLGRMVTRNEGTTSPVTSTWTYDNATKGIGLLDNVTRAGITNSYGYDSIKRPQSNTTNVSSINYTYITGYDAFNRVSTVDYPNSGLTVKYNYYTNGLLKEITNAAGTTSYWKATAYTAADQVKGEQWGNGVTGTRDYDDPTSRLVAIKTGTSNGIQNLAYDYYRSGNLKQRTNNKSNVTEKFSYDALDRLTSVFPSNGPSVSYEYDKLGNIKYKSGTGSYTYGRPHSVTQVAYSATAPYTSTNITGTSNYILNLTPTTGVVDCKQDSVYNVLDLLCINQRNTDATQGGLNTTYTYDANGNMLNGAGRAITYTLFNKPASIAASGSTTAFTYDPAYQRVVKAVTAGSTTTMTTTVGKLYEKVQTGSTTEHRYYISAAGRMVTMVKTNGTTSSYYIHTDMLGSVDVITNSSGADAGNISFDESGDDRLGNWGAGTPSSLSLTKRGYTGHEADTESGLINMNARLYDPMLGRFISADPTLPNVYNPQALNRYSYVLNNPFRYTDPTGYIAEPLPGGWVFEDQWGLTISPDGGVWDVNTGQQFGTVSDALDVKFPGYVTTTANCVGEDLCGFQGNAIVYNLTRREESIPLPEEYHSTIVGKAQIGARGNAHLFNNQEEGYNTGHAYARMNIFGMGIHSYGTWGKQSVVDGVTWDPGLRFDFIGDRPFIASEGYPYGESTRVKEVDYGGALAALGLVNQYQLMGSEGWRLGAPCSTFAHDFWYATTKENLNTQFLWIFSNPYSLRQSIDMANAGQYSAMGPISGNIGRSVGEVLLTPIESLLGSGSGISLQ